MINWDISPIIHARGKKLMSEPVFVRIDGAIEESMVRTFREQMDYAANTGQPVIPVIINSPGGDVWTMNAMIGIIDSIRRRAHVATIVEGKACSAGAWIFAAGDTRFVGLRMRRRPTTRSRRRSLRVWAPFPPHLLRPSWPQWPLHTLHKPPRRRTDCAFGLVNAEQAEWP